MTNRLFISIATLFVVLNYLGVKFASAEEINILDVENYKGDLSDVRYLLWTRSNPGDEDYYDLEFGNLANLQESPFSDVLPTYFIFHGYNGNGTGDWILQGKSNLLSIEDCNFISVEYYELISGINYNAAVKNVYEVGNYTASLIDWLVQVTAVETTGIQLIGWSLGAHTAGMVGRYTTSGTIDRITGLDPAGPLFYNATAEERLDKSHASFVDIIHTNGGLIALDQYGLYKPIGHIDFYPNGGEHQPGCLPVAGCSHERAPAYWVESILIGYPELPNGTENAFVSWPCQDWDTFKQGSCTACDGQGCLNMGFHLNARFEATSTYYLRTNSDSPFALGDVQN